MDILICLWHNAVAAAARQDAGRALQVRLKHVPVDLFVNSCHLC